MGRIFVRPGTMANRNLPIARGLVGAWPMDEGAGSVVHDLSGHNVLLTANSAPVWTGGYLDLDGTDDYLYGSLPGLSADSAYSYVLRIRWPYVHYKVLLNSKDGANKRHLLIYHYNNLLGISRQYGGLYFADGFTVLDTAWHTLVINCSKSATAPVLWLDGVQQSSAGSPTGFGVNGSANDIRIGARLGATLSAADADIDVVLLYNRTLSPSEIKQIYADPDAWRRWPHYWTHSAGAPAGLPIPIAQHHYRQRRTG